MWVYLLLVILGSGLAHGNCKEVRLDKNGGPFEKIPVYDQMRFSEIDPAICYAVTAAQLIDADRFFRGDSLETLTSPISVASRAKITSEFKKEPGINSLGGDETFTALSSVKNKNVCEQRFFENFVSLIGKREKNPLPASSYRGLGVSSTANFLTSLLNQRLAWNRLGKFEAGASAPVSSDFPCLNPYVETRLGFDENIEAIRRALVASLKEEKFELQIAKSIAAICQKHQVQIGDIRTKNFNGFTEAEIDQYAKLEKNIFEAMIEGDEEKYELVSAKMDRMLDQKIIPTAQRMMDTIKSLLGGEKPVPVGIGYHTNLIIGAKGGRHASVLVGQRPGVGGCEFLIRDSYGPACAEQKVPYVRPCENGSIWVPEKDLATNLSDINWIER